VAVKVTVLELVLLLVRLVPLTVTPTEPLAGETSNDALAELDPVKFVSPL
jgi:hypothetical protein